MTTYEVATVTFSTPFRHLFEIFQTLIVISRSNRVGKQIEKLHNQEE